jgi:(4-O-methyl)-D-glucuronate---lignin esterase
MPFGLDGQDAAFVVLRGSPDATGAVAAQVQLTTVGELDSGWHIGFGESPAKLPATLHSWHQSTNPEIKYFSGTVTYSNHFDLPATSLGQGRLLLDLGEVHEVASVSVNGRLAGIVWKPPYRVEVGDLLVPGRNVVEATVANLWVNQLIGDAQPGAVARAFTTGPAFRSDAPLRPSGLIGPVRLLAEGREKRVTR